MTTRQHFFTSESVSMGHPDKLADQISDAILDEMIRNDPNCRVACETMVTTGMAVIAGEVSCDTYVEIADIVRKTAIEIGYDGPEKGLDGKSCAVLVSLDQQSPTSTRGSIVTSTAGARTSRVPATRASCSVSPAARPRR